MIAHIRGTIITLNADSAVVDVGGIGYRVHIPLPVRAELAVGKEADFLTHLSVRENALDLYGFTDQSDLDFFELLISVSGVGPKTALGILSLAPAETLTSAIRAGDTSYLTKVSGIGKKSADRIVVELRDKLGALDEEAHAGSEDVDVLEALQSLGYKMRDAREALKRVDEKTTGTQARLKEALKILGGN